MPIYEYRCRACGDTFERLRPAAEADAPTSCPAGHDDATRLVSAIARRGTTSTSTALPIAGSGGGSCCGGGCCG